jgi:hypothetical protein
MDPHEKLLTKWSQQPHHQGKGKCFIKDGIVDPHRWISARPKILLLLKEAYHEESGFWDLRDYVRQEAPDPHGTLRNSAYWCYAIQSMVRGSLPPVPFQDTRKCEYDKAVEFLRSSAVVNIKKSEGTSTSSDEDIARCAKKDGLFIQQQIEWIKPDVVVCGNTWKHVEHLWQDKDRIYDGVWRVQQAVFIDFWHPSFPISDELKYYALVGLVLGARALSNVAAA